MSNIHRINDYGNNNNRNFAGGNNPQNADIENEPGYVNIPFLSTSSSFNNSLYFSIQICSLIN